MSADTTYPRPVVAATSDAILAGRPATTSVAWLTDRHTLLLALTLVIALASGFRLYHLDYGGFSEDEVNKVNAVRAYQEGEFSANAEHPMLTKVAMLGSTSAAAAWNRAATRYGWPVVSPEAALRLPNALMGAATVVPLFLLVRSFFGPMAGAWASLLLALDVNVAGVNRIGKEDTFLVFFLLLASWLYEEARVRHLRDRRPPHGWYAASGVAFGLMLASKYMPYYLGLWAIFGLAVSSAPVRLPWRRRAPQRPQERGQRQRASLWFYAAIVGAFVVANPAILLPGTWHYLLGYVREHTVTHHGAYFAGRVYLNMMSATPWGLPWHFYLTFFLTKVPLPVLVMIAIGLVELVRRRRERGAVYLRVFLLFFLLPASLAASKFARYLLPTMIMLDIVAALGVVRMLTLLTAVRGPALRQLATAGATAVVVGGLLLAQVGAAPYPTLHQNAIGRALGGPGSLFPNDELYDMGVREAVTWIARRAAPGAAVVSDAPGAVGEYLLRTGRRDLQVRSLSMQGVPPRGTEAWVLAQNSHACLESEQVVDQVRRRQVPAFVYRVRGSAAVEVFRLP